MFIRCILSGFFLLFLASCGPQTYNYSNVNNPLPQLIVNADATVKAKPDLLQMRLGVVTESVDAGSALADNNLRMQSLMDMLAKIGISRDELATGQFQIRPEWSVPPRPTPANWKREIVAYRVSNDLNLSTTRSIWPATCSVWPRSRERIRSVASALACQTRRPTAGKRLLLRLSRRVVRPKLWPVLPVPGWDRSFLYLSIPMVVMPGRN